MPLTPVQLDWETRPLPGEDELGLVEDAQERIERFFHRRTAAQAIPSFVSCDFIMVGRALDAVIDAGLAPGPVFCEWGSGFSVVAGLAALQGLSSHAIEIHRDLVAEGERLLRDHGIEVELAQGSLVPEDGDEYGL